MDKFPTKKARVDWKNCDLEEAADDTNNNISTMNTGASTSIQITDSVASGILELNAMSLEAECIVELSENLHFRIYVEKFGSLVLEDEGMLSFFSLCVSVQPPGGTPKDETTGQLEPLELNLKVDRLTEEHQFYYTYLPETDVTITSEEDYRGIVVHKYFCTRVPTEGFKFGITLTMKMKPKPLLANDVAVRDDCDENETLSCSLECFDVVDNLSEVKLKAEDGTTLDAWNFLLAAHSEMMTTNEASKYDSGAESLDLKNLVRAMLEWMDLGEINGLTSKWVQELFQNISTDIQLQEFKTRLLEEAYQISYGDDYRKKGMNLRIKIGKELITKRLKVFIQEFVEMFAPAKANL